MKIGDRVKHLDTPEEPGGIVTVLHRDYGDDWAHVKWDDPEDCSEADYLLEELILED